jgi:hypothetical protein
MLEDTILKNPFGLISWWWSQKLQYQLRFEWVQWYETLAIIYCMLVTQASWWKSWLYSSWCFFKCFWWLLGMWEKSRMGIWGFGCAWANMKLLLVSQWPWWTVWVDMSPSWAQSQKVEGFQGSWKQLLLILCPRYIRILHNPQTQSWFSIGSLPLKSMINDGWHQHPQL